MPLSSCKICESSLRSEIESKDSSCKADQTIRWAREKGVRLNRSILARHRAEHSKSAGNSKNAESSNTEPNKKSAVAVSSGNRIDDLTFLDAVTERAYKKLLAGDYDLKIEAAFKAIEIKHKLSDESSNEKLLLEILSEIRADELRNAGRKQTLLSETA